VGQTQAGDELAPRRRARGDRTRDALVDEALRLFGAKGVDATSVDEITAAAAVAKGTFYVHFARKQDVLLEHAARIMVEIDDLSSEGGFRASTLRLAGRLSGVDAELPRSLRGRIVREIVGNPEDWLRILGDRKTLRQLVEPLVEAGQRHGEVRTDLSPGRLAQALTILWLDTIVGWSEREEARDLGPELEQAVALFLDGARPRG
jgi:AcrR family transcriptional regulator